MRLLDLSRLFGGRLRIIATSRAERSPLLPEVPTFKEQGFPSIEGTGWLAFYAPTGTAKPSIARWSNEIAIATSGAERSPLSPAVPTFREQGLAAVDAVGWVAVYARAGTPKALINRLSAAIVETVRRPEIRERFLSLGVEPTRTTPEALAAIMAADTARWAPIVRASGFTAE